MILKETYGDSCLNYASDKIRLDYLKQGLEKPQVSDDGMIDPSNIEGAEDLVVVLNHGNYVMFYEMFVESCWDALFEKPEYVGLDEETAIEKLVMNRFTKIAEAAGEKVLDWKMDWEDEILSIKISNSKGKTKMKQLKEVIQEAIKSSEKSEKIKEIAKKGDLNISKYDMDELIMGYDVELEHGTVNPVTNVTDDDPISTLKIAIAHLNEVPDYYIKLKKNVENEEAKEKPKNLLEKKKKINENDDMSEKKSKNKLIIKNSVDNMTPEKIELTKTFIAFCLKYLKIDEPVTIYFTGKRGGPIKTTASFFPDDNEIWIYCKNRNMIGDIYRSTAHELRHLKQNIDGEIKDNSGEDGSPEENAANQFSGLMIRKFGKIHPEIYQ